MAQLIDITRVVVGTEYLTATVHISDDGPLMTSEDLEGTTRVYNLLPTIIEHACAGDAGMTFKDCMGDTEVAHLLEHVTVELLARSNLTDEVIAGRTWRELAYERTYSIQLPCIDDVLVCGALSSAIWIVTWAFSGGVGAVPDVDATVKGLVQLVETLPIEGGDEPLDSFYEDDAATDEFDDFDSDFDDHDDYDEQNDDEVDRGPSMSQKII